MKLQKQAARVGFDWPGPGPVIDKLHEEIEEVRAEFAAVAADPGGCRCPVAAARTNSATCCSCAPTWPATPRSISGAALRRANHKFERRFRMMEALAEADGGLAGQSLEAQDRYWIRAKQAEKGGAA